MNRRRLLAFVGGAVVAVPLAASAQLRAMPVVGYVSNGSREAFAPYVAAFIGGLAETGYIEGQNVAVEYRWVEGRFDRRPALIAELVGRPVNVLVVSGSGVNEARAATTTIPVVAQFSSDPVKSGYVASFNRPGGNITGASQFTNELGPKRLELLREIVPGAAVIAVLSNPENPGPDPGATLNAVVAAGRAVGQRIEIVTAGSDGEIDAAFAVMGERQVGGLVVLPNAFFNSRREKIVALAAHHAIPAIYEWREFADAGGLMSYGTSFTDAQRQVGRYVGAILKGAKPAELPVVQNVKIELVVNLKTARTLGLTIPQSLFGRADEVIE